MTEIVEIYFDGASIVGVDQNGDTHRQSLLWYPNLMSATEEQRMQYVFGLDGIHWRALDEDVSFESFFYDDAEPSALQKFFLTHPEISISGFAKRMGICPSLLNNFIKGFKTPSKEQESQILQNIRNLGREMAQV